MLAAARLAPQRYPHPQLDKPGSTFDTRRLVLRVREMVCMRTRQMGACTTQLLRRRCLLLLHHGVRRHVLPAAAVRGRMLRQATLRRLAGARDTQVDQMTVAEAALQVATSLVLVATTRIRLPCRATSRWRELRCPLVARVTHATAAWAMGAAGVAARPVWAPCLFPPHRHQPACFVSPLRQAAFLQLSRT